MRSITTDFYLNLDRWESLSAIERARGRWEARSDGPAARLEPILREALFQAAFAITNPGAEVTEKARKKILSQVPPEETEGGPTLQAWRYVRAAQFAHGWQKAFTWNAAGIAQLQRILGSPVVSAEDPAAEDTARLLGLRREAAAIAGNVGGVGLIEIGTFIGGLRHYISDQSTNKCLYLLALRLLVLQKGYVQTCYAPIEKVWMSMTKVPPPSTPPRPVAETGGDEPLGLWLDEAIAILVEVGRLADDAWDRMRLASTRSALQEQILSFAQRNGRLTAGEAMRATGANRNTVKDNLARLVEEGVLLKKGIKRGTVYLPC